MPGGGITSAVMNGGSSAETCSGHITLTATGGIGVGVGVSVGVHVGMGVWVAVGGSVAAGVGVTVGATGVGLQAVNSIKITQSTL